MSEGNIHAIYQLLLQDKKLEFAFRSEQECKNFRTRLAKFKSAQDKILRSVDLLEERQALRCEIQASLNPADPQLGAPIVATFWLEIKEKSPHWEFKVIEETSREEVEEESARASLSVKEKAEDATLI